MEMVGEDAPPEHSRKKLQEDNLPEMICGTLVEGADGMICRKSAAGFAAR